MTQAAQQAFFSELFPDVLSFAGAVMIRRILGIAHVVDFEQIADADTRSTGYSHTARCLPPPSLLSGPTHLAFGSDACTPPLIFSFIL